MSSTQNQKKARSARNGTLATQKKSSTSTRRSKNRNGNRKKRPSARPVFRLSPCAAAFAQAQLDPFGSMGNELPCIPDNLDLPSQKFCTLNRGVFVTGTLGFGFITLSGRAFGSDSVLSLSSLTNFDQNVIPSIAASGKVYIGYNTRYPWTTSEPRRVRSVGFGLRCRYIGTNLNMGGRLLMGALNSNIGGGAETITGSSFVDLLGRNDVYSYPVTRSWKTVAWRPAAPELYDYSFVDYPNTTTAGNVSLFAAYEGTAGNLIEYEVVQYFEAIPYGTSGVTAATRSHSDPVGLGVVRDFLASENVQSLGSSAFQHFLTFAKNGAAAAASSYFGVPGAAMPLALGWKDL